MKKERIEDIVIRLGTPVAQALNLELVDVEYKKEGANWVLRCFIDCETGVGIEECQRYSEALEKVLDTEDPIPGSYLLEVSSPGLERPLKKEQDYIRFAGNQVEIKLHKALNNQKKYRGELLGLDELKTTVRLNTGNQVMAIPLPEIAKANLIADFSSGTERGKKGK
ncbi:MAG TPA: ribosome maturation factor RimP [Bacillota bacterium]